MKTNEPHSYPDELITAYLNDELPTDRREELEEWVSSDPAHKRYLYEMTEAWLASTALLGNNRKSEEAYRHFRFRLARKRKGEHRLQRFWWLAAAVWMGLLLAGAGYYLGNSRSVRLPLQARHCIEVPLGSKSRISLPDGSVVWLNAGSKLSYTARFSEEERNVVLEGEGYFEVARNEKLPFVVRTGEIDLRVLGTKFNVKAYGDEEWVEVILAEGSVRFLNKKDESASFTMVPRQQALYNKKTGRTDIREVPVQQAGGWTTGSHFFNELTLEQIAGRLEKVFDVTFVFHDEKKKKLTFYGDFREEDTLDDILEVLASSGKFKYRKIHTRIEIE